MKIEKISLALLFLSLSGISAAGFSEEDGIVCIEKDKDDDDSTIFGDWEVVEDEFIQLFDSNSDSESGSCSESNSGYCSESHSFTAEFVHFDSESNNDTSELILPPLCESPYQANVIELLQSSGINAIELSAIFKCEPENLLIISNIDTLAKLKDISPSDSKINILKHLAVVNDRGLFELFFQNNLESIATFNSDWSNDLINLGVVIFNCAIVDSVSSLMEVLKIFEKFYIVKRFIKASDAIIVASERGSANILQLFIDKRFDERCDWEWRKPDRMAQNGNDGFSAALFLGAKKTIENGHLECLDILIKSNVDLSWNKFNLLAVAAKTNNIQCFDMVYIPSSAIFENSSGNYYMNSALKTAINFNNEDLAIYILSLDYDYSLFTENHFAKALSHNNLNIIMVLLSKLSVGVLLVEKLRDFAISVQSEELFKVILKRLQYFRTCNFLFEYISNPEYYNFIRIIVENTVLAGKDISKGLLKSIEIGSTELIELFLSQTKRGSNIVKNGFVASLHSNDINLILTFVKHYENLKDLINLEPNSFSNLISKLFEDQHWTAIRFLVQYFQNPNFPHNLFMSSIILTDQIDIAQTAFKLGGTLPDIDLSTIKNEQMRILISSEC